MSRHNQDWIQNGILVAFIVVAAILFLTNNAKIAWLVIVIGVVTLGILLVSRMRKRDKSARTLDQKDIAQFKILFSEKSAGELKTIYAKRATDEYQDEAIEAVRQILVERRELT
jgi:hypothetical protein